jgi:hypothetical protein
MVFPVRFPRPARALGNGTTINSVCMVVDSKSRALARTANHSCALDRLLGGLRPGLTLVGTVPGGDKTAFALNCAVRAGARSNVSRALLLEAAALAREFAKTHRAGFLTPSRLRPGGRPKEQTPVVLASAPVRGRVVTFVRAPV